MTAPLAQRLAAAALAAASLALAAPASHAAPVTPDVFSFEFGPGDTGRRRVMGGLFLPGGQDPVLTRFLEFQITNFTGDTLKSFVLDAPSPPPVTFSDFDGPAGSFSDISDPLGSSDAVIAIGGIHVASGETLTFLLKVNRTLASVTSVGIGGTPSADEINPVPLPAAAWLLLGGLGALGAVARAKRAA